MANTTGEKELKTDWDEHENIGKKMNLVAENSLVPKRERVGL